MITTLALNPAIDITITVDELNPDDSNRVEKVTRTPGGKGVNVSRIAKVLGAKVTTLGLLGGYQGTEFKKMLEKEGLYIWAVDTDSPTRENIAIVNKKNNRMTRFNLAGGVVAKQEYAELINLLKQLADTAKIFVLSGSIPPGIPKDSYFRLISLIHSENKKCRIVLDADGETLGFGIKAKPFLIKPNEHELERLAGKKLKSNSEKIKAMREIQNQGVQMIVVSMGSKGSLALMPDRTLYLIEAPNVKVRSTLGAGDALVAGIVRHLQHKENDFLGAVMYGTAVSSAKVMCDASTLCYPRAVAPLLKRVKIKKLEA
jgi:1-phosphofructokinase